jgi:filamentous hemagglutinin family protein
MKRIQLSSIASAVMLLCGASAWALPQGGVVTAGSASVGTAAGATTITQTTARTAINWQSFNIGAGEAVRFVQPTSSSVALNRVVGPDASSIFGTLSANGRVFLVNPGGILFAPGASVNVGGLVASTLNIADSDFMAGRHLFSGAANGSVINQGAITTTGDGGYVALMGGRVVNEGVITARLGTVALVAGTAVTLDIAGDNLVNVVVDQGALNGLVSNGNLIMADGGRVIMTAQGAGALLSTVVNNTGVIQAQTIDQSSGSIKLLGDMQTGTLNVAGTLDASAPHGGNGGFIETSAAQVNISAATRITTLAPTGVTGTWLIDPQDFIVGAGGNIAGSTLSALLVTNSVVISTVIGTDATVAGTPPVSSRYSGLAGAGDIVINDALAWTATPSTTTLTLNAARDITINAAISPTNGNLSVCCGRDINLNGALTLVNGSALLGAGRNVTLAAAMTATDGNITVCAANDINVGAAMTLTRGSVIPSQSLGLARGLVLQAGTGGTGPGTSGGTVIYAPLAPAAAVKGPDATVAIYYNPSAYTTPTDYSSHFNLSLGATLAQYMLVFPAGGDKKADGTTLTALTGLKGLPPGVTLIAGPGSTANFDNAAVGAGKSVTFTGYTLTGPSVTNYALAVACCGPAVGKTTASILPVVVVPPVIPPVVPPVIVPPEVVGGSIPVGVDVPIPSLGPTPTADIFAVPPENFPVDHVPDVVPPWVSTVVVSETPPQLLSLVPPPVLPPPAPPIVPVVVPKAAPVPPPVFVPPPRRERKIERN